MMAETRENALEKLVLSPTAFVWRKLLKCFVRAAFSRDHDKHEVLIEKHAILFIGMSPGFSSN